MPTKTGFPLGICHFRVTPRHKVTRVLKLLDNKNILLCSDVLLRACPKMACDAFASLSLLIGSRALVYKYNKKHLWGAFLLSGKRDSNPRPSAWEANALPTELLPRCFRLRRYNFYFNVGCCFDIFTATFFLMGMLRRVQAPRRPSARWSR